MNNKKPIYYFKKKQSANAYIGTLLSPRRNQCAETKLLSFAAHPQQTADQTETAESQRGRLGHRSIIIIDREIIHTVSATGTYCPAIRARCTGIHQAEINDRCI